MALNGNILLPSFFCQWSGVSGQSAVLLAPALDHTLALSGPQRGDEELEGGSVLSAVYKRRASRPRNRRDASETAGKRFGVKISGPTFYPPSFTSLLLKRLAIQLIGSGTRSDLLAGE